MAGDVLTTTTAGAERLPGSRTRRSLPARHARRNGPGDGDRAAVTARPRAPRRQRARNAGRQERHASAAQPSAAPPGVGVRRRLARLGAQRGSGVNPVLEPLIKTIRAHHPKADVRTVERAYDVAAHWHRDQKRK